jgi:NADH-quinone oxidoreductase subunit J
MSLYNILFYLLAIFVMGSTLLAITRKEPVHVVVYLIFSFFGSAMIYFLLGAPFLAALEVIIYAGAIMVMFLFMIMTLKSKKRELENDYPSRRPWFSAIILGGISLVLLTILLWIGPDHGYMLKPAMATPRALGNIVFSRYWFSVEVVSLILFVALVGALYLAKENGKQNKINESQREAS